MYKHCKVLRKVLCQLCTRLTGRAMASTHIPFTGQLADFYARVCTVSHKLKPRLLNGHHMFGVHLVAVTMSLLHELQIVVCRWCNAAIQLPCINKQTNIQYKGMCLDLTISSTLRATSLPRKAQTSAFIIGTITAY